MVKSLGRSDSLTRKQDDGPDPKILGYISTKSTWNIMTFLKLGICDATKIYYV